MERDEDEEVGGPMGMEEKIVGENKRVERDDWLGGNSEGRMTCGIARVELREERGDWGRGDFGQEKRTVEGEGGGRDGFQGEGWGGARRGLSRTHPHPRRPRAK